MILFNSMAFEIRPQKGENGELKNRASQPMRLELSTTPLPE
jgi:hypothetical protein